MRRLFMAMLGLRRKIYLLTEFSILFIGLPTAVTLRWIDIHPMAVLWLAFLACLLYLLRDRGFDRQRLWEIGDWKETARRVIIKFLIATVLLTAWVLIFIPEYLFGFPKRVPGLWALVMLLYPIFSVYPQGIIHRAFLFQRYKDLIPGRRTMILVSALAFSYMHIVLENPYAVVLTFIGGLLFARTYDKTHSLVISVIEHAMYGNLLFTIGLGRYIYTGTVR